MFTERIDKTSPKITMGTISSKNFCTNNTATFYINIKESESGIDGTIAGAGVSAYVNGVSRNIIYYMEYSHGNYLVHLTRDSSSGGGPITIKIAANSIKDKAGNGNTATTLSTGITYIPTSCSS